MVIRSIARFGKASSLWCAAFFVTTGFCVEAASTDAQQGEAAGQRAALYEENAADPQHREAKQGGAVWLLENLHRGHEPLAAAVRAQIDVPDAMMSLIMLIRRNLDTTLPASYAIEVAFTTPPGEAVRGIGQIQFKNDENVRGTAVAGLPVRVRDNLFLKGLSDLSGDIERSTDLMLKSNWIDLPIRFTSGKRAVLSFGKGPLGHESMPQLIASSAARTIADDIDQRDVVLKRNESFEAALRSNGASREQVHSITMAFGYWSVGSLVEGDRLQLHLKRGARIGERSQLIKVTLLGDEGVQAIAAANDDGEFVLVFDKRQKPNKIAEGTARETGVNNPSEKTAPESQPFSRRTFRLGMTLAAFKAMRHPDAGEYTNVRPVCSNEVRADDYTYVDAMLFGSALERAGVVKCHYFWKSETDGMVRGAGVKLVDMNAMTDFCFIRREKAGDYELFWIKTSGPSSSFARLVPIFERAYGPAIRSTAVWQNRAGGRLDNTILTWKNQAGHLEFRNFGDTNQVFELHHKYDPLMAVLASRLDRSMSEDAKKL